MKENIRKNFRFLDRFKLKQFTDNKVNVTEKLKFVLGIIENIVGKRIKCLLPAFTPFSQCFQKASYVGSLKVGLCVKWFKKFLHIFILSEYTVYL